MNNEYNKVFETLVQDEYDLVGLIAYGLYKREKRKQIIDIKNEKGRPPTSREYEMIESLLTKHLDFYREKANQTLNATIEYIIENEKENLYNQYFRTHEHLRLDEKISCILENTSIEKLHSKIDKTLIYTKPKTLFAELKIEILGNVAWLIFLIFITTIVYFNSGSIKTVKEKLIETLQEKVDSSNIAPKK